MVGRWWPNVATTGHSAPRHNTLKQASLEILDWLVYWWLNVATTGHSAPRHTTLKQASLEILDWLVYWWLNAPATCKRVLSGKKHTQEAVRVGWLLNVPANILAYSGTYLLNATCCHTDTDVADQTFYLTQSQCMDT